MPAQEEINKVSAVFGALSHPTRIKFLLITGETKKPLHIKAIAKILKADYAGIPLWISNGVRRFRGSTKALDFQEV